MYRMCMDVCVCVCALVHVCVPLHVRERERKERWYSIEIRKKERKKERKKSTQFLLYCIIPEPTICLFGILTQMCYSDLSGWNTHTNTLCSRGINRD